MDTQINLGQLVVRNFGKTVFLIAIALLLTQADCGAVESNSEKVDKLTQLKQEEQELLDHYLKEMESTNSIGSREIENLANRYALLGKSEEEEKLCRKYLKLLRTTRFNGREDLQARLAKILISEHKYKEAEEIYKEQIKEASFSLLPNGNTYLLSSRYSDLAWLYVLQDRFAEAAPYYKLAAESLEKDRYRSSEAKKCWDAYNNCLAHSNQKASLWASQSELLFEILGKLATNLLSVPPGIGYLIVFLVKTVIAYPVLEVVFPQRSSVQRQRLAIAVFLCSTLFVLGLYYPVYVVMSQEHIEGFNPNGIYAFVIAFALPPFIEVLYLCLLSRARSTLKVIGWLFFLNFISVLASLAIEQIVMPFFQASAKVF